MMRPLSASRSTSIQLGAGACAVASRAARIRSEELLIQLNLHQFAPLRQGDDAALERFAIDVDPTGRGRMRGGIAGRQNRGMLLAAFANRDDVAYLDRSRRDVAL